MIAQMQPGDEARLDAFLARHADSSMFLRSNLAGHGLGVSSHRHSTTYFCEIEAGEIIGVLARTRSGLGLIQAPLGCQNLVHAVAGKKLQGMTGQADQVKDFLERSGLSGEAFALRHDEPLMVRDLQDLPEGQGILRIPEAKDELLLGKWFAQYLLDTGLEPEEDKATSMGRERAAMAIGNDDVALYSEGRQALGMTAINAQVADRVQIGGVFVPAEFRGRGVAGRMVASHLKVQRSQGAVRAVLFANNEAAERACSRIGFERVGSYCVALLTQEREVRP